MTTEIQKLLDAMGADDDIRKYAGDLEAALDNASTPMAALTAAYNFAPSNVIRAAIDQKAMEVLRIDMPMLREIHTRGAAMLRDEVKEIAPMFEESMDAVTKEAPEHAPSATVRQMGGEIAELVDKTIRRVLLEDGFANRQAYSEIVSAHARLTAALDSLALTEDQTKMAEEALEAQREAAGGTQ